MAGNIIFKFLVAAIFFNSCFPLTGISQPDIPMDPDLKSNYESWHVKIKQNGIWGTRPAQVNFGPLKTITTESGKSIELSREVDRELFLKNIHSLNAKESRLDLVLNDHDTVQIRMLTLEEEEIKKRNVAGTLSNAEPGENEMYRASSWVSHMILQFPADSSVWLYFSPGADSSFAMLENLPDSTIKIELFRINNLEGKKSKEIMFTQPALGFGFRYQGKEVAALQTILKQMVWVSKTLDPKLRSAILATAAALLATIKSGNANGF